MFSWHKFAVPLIHWNVTRRLITFNMHSLLASKKILDEFNRSLEFFGITNMRSTFHDNDNYIIQLNIFAVGYVLV